MFNRIILFVTLLALSAAATTLSQETPLGKMEDTLARGYLAANKNDIKGAFDHFTKAMALADEAGSWRGFVDAGNAFSALGDPKKALQAYKSANTIALSQDDWRGLVTVSYCYASLPTDMNITNQSISALEKALRIAATREDWHGMLETSKAFNSLIKPAKVKEILVISKDIVLKSKMVSAATSFAQVARKTNNMAIYEEYVQMARDFAEFEKKYSAASGEWNPYAKDLPEKESITTAHEGSLDGQITANKDLLARVKEKEKNDSKYYDEYKGYYSFPYFYIYYGHWQPLGSYDAIYTWSNYYLARYKLADGVYIYAR